jgi:hypothetical protein
MKTTPMKIKQILIMLAAMIALLGATAKVQAATSTFNVASGSWNTAGNWSPSGIPGSTATVVIPTGDTVSGLGAAQSCASLELQGSAVLTVDNGLSVSGTTTFTTTPSGQIKITSTTGTKTFTGDVTIPTGCTWNNSGNAAVTFGGNLSVASDATLFTIGTGVQTFSGSSKTLGGTLTTYAIPSLTVSGTLSLGGSATTLTVSTALAGSGTFTVPNSGALNIGQTSTPGPTLTCNSGSTVTYTGSGPNIKVATYYNLTINSPPSNWTGGASTISSGGTLTIGGTGNMGNLSGLTINGNLAITGTGTTTANAMLNVGGNVTVSSGILFAQYGINVTGTTTLSGTGILYLNNQSSGTGTFTGDFTMGTGTTFDSTHNGGLPALTFVGNLTVNGGTFTISTATTTFSGTSKTITGTISIPNVAVTGTIANAGTLTVTTALSGAGTLTQNNGSTLNIGGTSTITTLTATTSANTVNYTKAGSQTVLATTYDSLTISGGGSNTKTLAGATTVNTTLTIAASTTLADGGFTLTAKAGVVNGGTHSGAGKISLTGGSGSHSLTGTGAYGNLELNDANNASIASGTSTVNGTLTLTSGVLSGGGGALTFGNSASVSRAAGSLSSLTPNFGTSINVTYNDVNPTTTGAELPSSGTALNNLTNANAAGVTLNASATLKGTLALNNGQLITSANTLTVTSTGTIVGGSSSSYVYGTLSRGFAAGSGKSGTFPVGDSSVYAPVSLASATVTVAGNLVVSTVANQNSQGAFSSSGLSQSKYVNRDWTITAANGYAESAGSITLNFANDTPVGGMSTSTDVVGKYSGSTWTHPTVASRTTTSITVSGITSFSDWVIGELPVPTFAVTSQTITYGASSKSLTGTLSANSGTVYPVNGSTVTASIANHPISGTVTDGTGDFTINYNAASLATDGVGSSPYTITYSFAGDANLVAAANDTSTTMTVNKAALSITANNKSKTYGSTVTLDGTVDFTPTGLQNSETVGSVTLTPSGGTAATDPVSGSPYTITPSDATGGTFNANNYTTITYNPGTLTVDPLAVSLTGSRAYDGTTNAAAAILSIANAVGGDNVTVASGTGGLAGKNVPAQAITSAGTLVLGNNAAGNYTLINASGSVTIAPINASVVSGITADDKVYDGTNTATISVTNTATFAGVVSGDDVTLDTNGYSAVFASVDVDTNIAVTVSGLTLDGADATNYTLTGPVMLTANITPAPLTVSGVTASDKVYDGTTNAVIDVTGAALVGVVDSDTNDVTLDTSGATGAFTDANVDSNKTVTVSGLTISGSATTNYTLTQPTTTASITPASLTITADDKSRTYGLPNPVLTASYNGFVNGEDTNVLTVQAVLSTMADTDSPVDTYPITVSGAAAANYTISYVDGTLTVAPQPELGNANWDGNQFVFTFSSLAGQAYQVEYNTNLTDSTWVPIGDPISGTGAQLSATNNITVPQIYFRLHILQQ